MAKSSKDEPKSLKNEGADEYGFTAIYQNIVQHAFPSKKIEEKIDWIFFPLDLVFVLALTNATINEGFNLSNALLWMIILFMIFSVMVIGIGWFIGFTSFAFWGPPPPLAWLVGRILITTKTPHHDRHGLTIKEIGHLKAIAETDQAAADWKNGFLTIGILTLLLATIRASTNDIEFFFKTNILVGPPIDLIFNLKNLSIFFGWTAATTLIALFARSIFRPLGEFISVEPINRTIINACHEAIALLEAKGLDQRITLNLVEKRLIARACECLIVSASEEKDYWFVGIHSFLDENNERWLLLPPLAKEKTASHLVRFRRRTQRWLKAIGVGKRNDR